MNNNGFKNFFHKVNLILVDNNNNFYGILKVKSIWIDLAVKNCFEQIVKDEFKTEEKFFEDFSGNLSIVIEKLEDTIKNLGVAYNVEFEYMGYEFLNVDNIFKKN